MSNTPAQISVIVPMYNAEAHVENMYACMKRQTYPHFTLILADDGSTDRTLEIARRLAQEDARVCVISLPHKGVSFARNAAIDAVETPWLTFVDVDDFVPADALEHLMEGGDADLVVGGHTVVNAEGVATQQNPCAESLTLTAYEAIPRLMRGPHLSAAWAKRYSTEKIKTFHIRNHEALHVAEDTCFVAAYLNVCHTFHLLPHLIYTYNAPVWEKKHHRPACEIIFLINYYHSLLAQIEKRLAAKNSADEVALASLWKAKRLEGINVFSQLLFYHLPYVSRKESIKEVKLFTAHYGTHARPFPHPRYLHSAAAKSILRRPALAPLLRGLFRKP